MIRIAQNDPATAHGVSSTLIATEATERLKAFRAAVRQTKNPLAIAQKTFRENITGCHVVRPNGSRALWAMGAVDFVDGEANLISIEHRNGRTDAILLAKVTKHAIARALQRTVGEDDIAAVRQLLWPFLIGVERHRANFGPGKTMKQAMVIRSNGILLGELQDGVLTFKTFLNPETCSDPWLAKEAKNLVGTDRTRIAFEFDE